MTPEIRVQWLQAVARNMAASNAVVLPRASCLQ